jgi:class 3 adenylate cyclase
VANAAPISPSQQLLHVSRTQQSSSNTARNTKRQRASAAITVLFSDLVNSTQIAAQLDPEEWREIVTGYHHAAAEAIERFGGHVAKKLGDGLLIYFGWPTAAEPEVVARHAEAAGRIDEAITYLQRAGEQAQTRSAHGEAIAQFRKAIALLETQPASAQRDTREVALQLTLGSSLNAVRGYAHPEVGAAYERARVLCEAVGDARPLGIALLGLATFHQGRGEVERARILAARLLTAAEQRGDTEMALLAHSTVANPEYFQGKFASALAHCEAVRTLYEPKRHHSLASVVTIDPGVDALCTGAWALWTLGWPDRAARTGVRGGRVGQAA